MGRYGRHGLVTTLEDAAGSAPGSSLEGAADGAHHPFPGSARVPLAPYTFTTNAFDPRRGQPKGVQRAVGQ